MLRNGVQFRASLALFAMMLLDIFVVPRILAIPYSLGVRQVEPVPFWSLIGGTRLVLSFMLGASLGPFDRRIGNWLLLVLYSVWIGYMATVQVGPGTEFSLRTIVTLTVLYGSAYPGLFLGQHIARRYRSTVS